MKLNNKLTFSSLIFSAFTILVLFSVNTSAVGGGPFPETYLGTAGNDTLIGVNVQDDYILGGAGNDRIEGLGGNDRIEGEAGDDTINGGNGNDTLFGGVGNDFINGGAGNDRIDDPIGNNGLLGGDGDDIITGGFPSYGLDRGLTRLNGANGNDFLRGLGGTVTYTGGAGADIFMFGNKTGLFSTINDYQPGIDKIAVEAGGPTVTARIKTATNEIVLENSRGKIVIKGQTNLDNISLISLQPNQIP